MWTVLCTVREAERVARALVRYQGMEELDGARFEDLQGGQGNGSTGRGCAGSFIELEGGEREQPASVDGREHDNQKRKRLEKRSKH